MIYVSIVIVSIYLLPTVLFAKGEAIETILSDNGIASTTLFIDQGNRGFIEEYKWLFALTSILFISILLVFFRGSAVKKNEAELTADDITIVE